MNDCYITAPVNGIETPFILSPTQWGWGLKAKLAYKPGDLVCHYQGEVISVPEYHSRVAEKVETGNLVFSYVQLSTEKILDPDYSDECIGKFANAACREIGEQNNCYYARDLHRGRVNIKAVKRVKPGDWILCAYGTAFSGQLRGLRKQLKKTQGNIELSQIPDCLHQINEAEANALAEKFMEKQGRKKKRGSDSQESTPPLPTLEIPQLTFQDPSAPESSRPPILPIQTQHQLPRLRSPPTSPLRNRRTSASFTPLQLTLDGSSSSEERPGADPTLTVSDLPDLLRSPPLPSSRALELASPRLTAKQRQMKFTDENDPLSSPVRPVKRQASTKFSQNLPTVIKKIKRAL
ncbi:hypothetical protein BLNAU_8993 [Blattamonas nauphoetae]|uniref:SET domain-containing protein n=1 Tax=Blattamonas nauphoetae TaxID=2049346 RepID=A0ABQ9XX21_9EUKA|nr:hypothetical protein BLNAU_8993 [Blattamonas nauphoetae]